MMMLLCAVLGKRSTEDFVARMDKMMAEREEDRRRAIQVLPLLASAGSAIKGSALYGKATAAFATVKSYTEQGQAALKQAEGVVGSINELVSGSSKDKYVGIEIKNKFGKYIKLEYRSGYRRWGYFDKACSLSVGPGAVGQCGLAKSWGTQGVYGMIVYRAKHGAKFATATSDLFIDVAIQFGTPYHSVHRNWFSIVVGEPGQSLQSGWPLYNLMYHYRAKWGDAGSGKAWVREETFYKGRDDYPCPGMDSCKLKVYRLEAYRGDPINIDAVGVKISALMSDAPKPILHVDFGPNSRIWEENADAPGGRFWHDLRNFYERECYTTNVINGVTWDKDCHGYFLHDMPGFVAGGYTQRAAEEVCRMDAHCSGYWFSGKNKRAAGNPLIGKMKAWELDENNNPIHADFSYLANAGSSAGWGLIFKGGSDQCDTNTCSADPHQSGNCIVHEDYAFQFGTQKQCKYISMKQEQT